MERMKTKFRRVDSLRKDRTMIQQKPYKIRRFFHLTLTPLIVNI